MTTPITLPPMDELTLTELRRRYEETTDAETRTRYQMLLLSLRGQTSSQIAHMVLRSQDTVVRVLKRFCTGGLDAVPRRTAPGRERTVTAAWEAELLRVIEADLWSQLPADLPALLALVPRADLYLQDEMQIAFHPTREPRVVSQGSTWATPGRGAWG